MQTYEVTIPATFRLHGTLTVPEQVMQHYPAVLIIAGSGKGNRDGNVKKLPLNLYKDLAEYLTRNGFITLRYDKRGTYQSEGNFDVTGVYDLIDDAVAAVKFLQNEENVDRDNIFILGHSEGALLAPAVFQQVAVAGLILLAGAARSSGELMQFQVNQLAQELKQTPGIKGMFFRIIKLSERIKRQNQKIIKKISNANKDVIRIKGMKLNAKWYRETLAYDVCEYLKAVTCPVLAISGTKDIQVPPEDVEKIAQLVQGEAEWHLLNDVNHILRKYEAEHSLLRVMKEYKALLDQPIDHELLAIIINWLNKQVKK